MPSLLHHNTFGLDVNCRHLVEYASLNELRAALIEQVTRSGEPWLHIGQGSNLLFTRDYDGTVFHSRFLGREILEEHSEEVIVRAGAGEDWDTFVRWCVERGFYGLENLGLIPGEVGASAVQNIGAYGVEAGDLIINVHTVDTHTGDERIFSHSECDYAYRSSIFKTSLKGRFVVTHVDFRLSRNFEPNLNYAALTRELTLRNLPLHEISARQLYDVIVDIRRQKLPDPKEVGSAGSFFMNPIVSSACFEELLRLNPQMPYYKLSDDYVKIPAGWLIEQCGWKGRHLGRAGVYDRQALVLVNLGGATGEEIVRLSEAIRDDVQSRFGVDIQPEVNFI